MKNNCQLTRIYVFALICIGLQNIHAEQFSNRKYYYTPFEGKDLLTINQNAGLSAQPQLAWSNTLAVGSTPASFAVSESGAATYSIPIQIAPGTGGMQPNLAITYNSQGGNGMLGQGWNLAGISGISRVGSNLYNDGAVKPVKLTAEDNFEWDGQRLMLVVGTNGANGAEYKTEVESFAKIFCFQTGGVVDRWEITTKDGTKLYFGKTVSTSNAVLKSSSNANILEWYIYKMQDIHGNYMVYNYTKDESNGETYISSIDYTGNVAANLTVYNNVVFTYETRTDQDFQYVAGYKFTRSKRLLRIDVKCEGASVPVRHYNITYQSPFNEISRLDKVTEFNNNEEQYNPIQISWGPRANFITAQSQPSTYGTGVNSFGDFNGDGITDFMAVKDETNGFYWYAVLGRPHGITNGADYDYVSGIENEKISFYPGDFDGDGRSEVLYLVKKKTGTYTLTLWKFINNTFIKTGYYNVGLPVINQLFVGDFDGDGQDEFMISETGNNLRIYDFRGDLVNRPAEVNTLLTHTTNEIPRVDDFNGDGIDDVIKTEDYIKVYSGGMANSLLFTSTFSVASNNTYFADFNGDQKMDVLNYEGTSSGWKYYLNSGNPTSSLTLLAAVSIDIPKVDTELDPNTDNIFLQDYDADGKTDILYATYNATTKVCSLNYTFDVTVQKRKQTNTLNDIIPSTYFFRGFVDMNGDGFVDLLYHTATSFYIILTYDNSGSGFGTTHHNHVSRITDGLNNRTDINYETITAEDSQIYTKGSGAVFPVCNVQTPLYVVENFEKRTSANALFEKKSFTYENLLLHLQGKGMLGFFRFITIDNLSGEKINNLYSLNLTYYYRYLSFISFQKSVYALGHNITSMSFKDINTQKKIFLPQIKSSTQTDIINDLQTFSEYTYDGDGNAAIIKVDSRRDDNKTQGHGIIDATVTTYVFTTKLAGCFYNSIPSRILSTYERPGKPFIRKEINYYYSGVKLDYKITDIGQTYAVRENYTWDACGNRTSIQVKNEANTLLLRSKSFTYETKKRFVITETNGLGHIINTTYNAKYGVPITFINAANCTTTYVYDNWGHLINSTSPYGTTNQSIAWYNNNDINITGALYFTSKAGIDGSIEDEFFDCLGRPVYKRTKGLGGTNIYSSTSYDNLGRINQVTSPYKAADRKMYTNYTYDIFNRVTFYENESAEKVVSYSYSNDHKITITDVLGNRGISWKITNAMGEVIQSHDNGGDIFYQYNAVGKVIQVQAPNATTTMTYDEAGNQLTLTDPDAGTTNYTYDLLGQLLTQKNPKNQTFTKTYDILGRTVTSSETTTGTNTYTYVATGNGLGQIASIENSITAIKYNYGYNAQGRLQTLTEKIEGANYIYSYEYDTKGRMNRMVYPGTFAICYKYDSYGFMNEITKDDNTRIWNLASLNAKGQPETVNFGNGLRTAYSYNADYRPSQIRTFKTSNNSNVQDLGFTWDHFTGDLLSRTDNLRSLNEIFTYDSLDRLRTYQVGSLAPDKFTMNYDNTKGGVISNKSDLGAYTYGTTKTHAVTKINTGSASIPAFTNNQSITYTSFEKVATIAEGTNNLNITYGPDQQRKISVLTSGAIVKKKIFAGGLYEKEMSGTSTIRELFYIPGLDSEAAIYELKSGTGNMYYIHKDYLGSYHTITDESGSIATISGIEQVYSFDPWGRRRSGTTWKYTGMWPNSFLLFDRGFTGHEHLDAFNLINMNGRVFDPYTASFLSPDNFVQNPGSTKGFNRYAYCHFNPFKYNDPSGNKLHWLDLLCFVDPTYLLLRLNTEKQYSAEEAFKRSLFNQTTGGLAFDAYAKWIKKPDYGNTQHNASTGQPGENASYVWVSGDLVCGYYFESFYEMVNFMRTQSETNNKEITGYILEDENGDTFFWVNDWSSNSDNESTNPYSVSKDPALGYRPRFDNKNIIGEVHTHPSAYYDRMGRSGGYDGPSMKDYETANGMGVPVYSIGPTTVSVILPNNQKPNGAYYTSEDFDQLSGGSYGFSSEPKNRCRTNPFYLGETEDWLNNPFYYTSW